MNNEILDKTYSLVDEIKDSKEYKRMIELKTIIDNDNDLKELILAFNKIKAKYEEVQKYGKFHPDLKKTQMELSNKKESLYSHAIIKEYKELEKSLQKTLDNISKEIAKTVSDKIKHPNEIGLINKH